LVVTDLLCFLNNSQPFIKRAISHLNFVQKKALVDKKTSNLITMDFSNVFDIEAVLNKCSTVEE
jgi:hypothetical protein